MIEVQIKSLELYNELKKYASYNSDLTKVCAFRDELSDMLKWYGVEFEEIEKPKIKPTLTITGRNIMKLENAPAEMLFFVGVRTEYDPTISINFMHEVNQLIESSSIIVDDKFKKIYSKLSYRSKISDLICANINFRGKGKLIDFIDPNLTIQSLKINDCIEKQINYKQIYLKVIENIDKKDKYLEVKCKNLDSKISQNIILRFYGKNPLLKTILFKNNKFSISTSKITEDEKNNLIIYDPIILPENLDLIKDIMYTPKSRNIPVDLYRNALYEFHCRYNIE